MTKKITERYFFYIILVSLGLITLYIVRNYIGLFFLAFIITMVFDPLYQLLFKKMHRATLASLLTTLLLILLVLIPLVLISVIAVSQAIYLLNHLPANFIANNPVINYALSQTQGINSNIALQLQSLIAANQGNLGSVVQSLSAFLYGVLINNVLPLISLSVQAITQTVFFFVLLVYLFPYRHKIVSAAADLTPLGKTEHHRFYQHFEAITVGTMKSIVVIGFVQGFLGGIMLTLLSFPASAFWGLLMAIASLIPMGSGVIWIPISIWLILTGEYLSGIILFIWGALVISSVDNIIRARLLSQGQAQLPEIITLLSVLGGISTFGFWGVIYGPVIAGLFYTALQIYREQRLKLL